MTRQYLDEARLPPIMAARRTSAPDGEGGHVGDANQLEDRSGVSGAHAALGRALCARAQSDPGRPHARQPHAAAVSDLCRPRRRPAQVGRRRQRVRRLLRRPRRAAAGPRTPGRGGGDRAPGEARHALGRLARAGGAMGRARQPPDPLRRTRALHRLGHRGLAPGAAAGARLHRQAEGDPLRRPLPRLARRGDGGCHVALRGRRARGHSGGAGRADHPAAGRRHRSRRRHA